MDNENVAFLHSVCLLSKFLRLWCQHRFSIPQKRTANTKLRYKSIDTIIVIVQASTSLTITFATFYFQRQRTANTKPSLSHVISTLLSILGLFIYVINILTDLRNQSRIWFIIAGLCDFDIVVKNSAS